METQATSLSGHPSSPGQSSAGLRQWDCIWSVVARTEWENISPRLGPLRFQSIFLAQLRMRRSKPRIFLKRKSKTHFEKGKKYFLSGPECFTSFVLFYVCFIQQPYKNKSGKK